MQKQVKKAIIPCAGLGTRFLPGTKAIPKEMLPILDTPAIQFIIDECEAAGIESVILVTSATKNSILDYFDNNEYLENRLMVGGKKDKVKLIHDTHHGIKIFNVRQDSPKGLAYAINCAREFVEDEPFAVLLPDEILWPTGEHVSGIGDCIRLYNKIECSVVGLMRVPDEETKLYGIAEPMEEGRGGGGYFKLKGMVEKPQSGAPSNLAANGRYVFTPKIFEYIDELVPGAGGEYQLTDAIIKMAEIQTVYGLELLEETFDCGKASSYACCVVKRALEVSTTKDVLLDYINKILNEKKETEGE